MSVWIVYHTDVNLLHAAAWKDFTGHLRYLEALNRAGEALELWRSVVEVQHLPATLAIKDPEQYPRMRRSVCTVPGCLACERGWGGYKFPWLGLWCQEAVVLKQNESITKAWSRWRLPRTRSWMLWEWQKDVCHLWESTHGNGMLCDFHTLHALQSGLRARDLCPDAWHRVVVAASQGQFGCTSHEDLFRTWRCWQLGSSAWVDPTLGGVPTREMAMKDERVRAQRSMVQWLEWEPCHEGFLLPAACRGCGNLTRKICSDCHLPECHLCLTEKWMLPCCVERATGDAIVGDIPAAKKGDSDASLLRQILRGA